MHSHHDRLGTLANQLGIHHLVENTLITMNDIKHFSFEQIADWIEVNL
jgi:hypothetical protein